MRKRGQRVVCGSCLDSSLFEAREDLDTGELILSCPDCGWEFKTGQIHKSKRWAWKNWAWFMNGVETLGGSVQ